VSPLDVVRVHPLCAETPVAALQCATTPAESVYIRSNFETPDAHDAWTVRVTGVVQRPISLTLADIAGLPQRSVHVTMECAGNWSRQHYHMERRLPFRATRTGWRTARRQRGGGGRCRRRPAQ
jgi:DMSO/TMAO reductase YedYZ molybdopterin-dependent catalytic subunit